jgi:tetratricopeptide (TPR) repeat protein
MIPLRKLSRFFGISDRKPTPTALRGGVGGCHEESNYHTAINFFNSAIYLDITCKEAYYARGTVKFQLSYFQEAIDDFNKVLSIDINPEVLNDK